MDIQALIDSAIGNSNFPFDSAENTTELFDCLSSLLPDCNQTIKSTKGKPERFIADFRTHLKTEDDVGIFIEKYTLFYKKPVYKKLGLF